MGVSAAAASAATHMAKLPTTFVSGLTHWRQGNVDTGTLVRVAIPGAIAAFVGAVVLVNLSLESAKTWMAGLLLFFGMVILLQFGFNKRLIPAPRSGHTAWWRMGPCRDPLGDDCHEPRAPQSRRHGQRR